MPAAPKAEQGSATGKWAATDLLQEYVDEAVLTYVNGQVYLSFGQLQIPPANPGELPLTSVEIRPVARVVFREASFHKVLGMLNSIAPKIKNSDAASGEE